MEDKWAFLQPWQEILHECKTLHDSLDVVDSREFRASHLPVRASLRCWPSLPKGYEQLAGRCVLPIPFPASRHDGEKLQRIREAMELFNVLATVSRPAFVQLLADCVVVADNFDDLLTPDFLFVFPVWECYLVGTVGSEDVVAEGSTVSWGALFGCPDDPREYSTEFCAAMETLEEMRRQVTEALCDFMGRQATPEWGEGCSEIEWTAEHVAVPTKGVQDAATSIGAELSVDSFSRKLGSLFDVDVPAVVQLCAVSDCTKMLKTWEDLAPSSEILSVETMKPNFSAPGGANVATALSRMNLTALRLSLDEIVDSVATSEAASSAGFLLSTLVCSRPVYQAPENYICGSSTRTRQGQLSDLEVTFAGDYAAGPVGFLSAMTESVSIQKLTLNMGTLGDRIWWLNQVRWGWLAYALWSNASSASAQSVRLTNIHLTASAVASVATAIANCYPPSILEQSTPGHSTYGFIDVKEGTKLRPRVLDGRDADNNVVLSRGFRCRARYDPTEMGDQAEVIVPGYGVCDLDLGDATHRFIPSDRQGHQSHALQSLSLEFFQIEDPSLVPDLLNLIGGSLRSLRMGMFWRGRRRCIALDTVAVACPRLEELHLTDFDVVLSSHRELDNWVRHSAGWISQSISQASDRVGAVNCHNNSRSRVTIHGSDTVTGLADRLRDPACRMSYQLEVLEIAVPRSVQRRTAYADAFTSLNDDYLAAAKERFPSRSKAAVISVVDEACDNARAVHRLNESMMGFIFEFAATPKRRVVRVTM